MTNLNEHAPVSKPNLWEARRKRALLLAERYPYAAEMLDFYAKLSQTQERIWQRALVEQPEAPNLERWALANNSLTDIMRLAESEGPGLLAEVAAGLAEASAELQQAILRAYLADIPLLELNEAEREPARFLARATLGPALEALDLESTRPGPIGSQERRCPWCWGLPQCKTVSDEGEAGAPARLVCSRCSRTWKFPRRLCASCGETRQSQLATFEAEETFTHLYVEACRSCQQYMVTVDLRQDGKAEPLLDEMCALPLDLWTREQGFSKVHPNLMGV
jgi:formate dehydrogenase accessory protein FdhE